MDNDNALLLERHDGWLRLTLNRPEKLNSFTAAMLDALAAAVHDAADDESVRAVLLDANGRGFCAGQDLSERDVSAGAAGLDGAAGAVDLGASLEGRYNPLVLALRSLPKPVVCAVNGVAAGAGANIALACDIVIAGRAAVFIQAFSRIGLVPDCGGSWQLPRLAGSGRAAALAMLAERVTAEQAAAWGMIWRVVEDAALAAVCRDTVQTLAAGSASANAETKALLNAAAGNSLQAQLELEAAAQRRCGQSDDYREGVSAFIEKRQPLFNQRD